MKRSLKAILSMGILLAFIVTSLGLTSIAVKSIKLNTAGVSIKVFKTYKLNVTFTPANATNKKVTFSSANKSIATVSSTGYIKGMRSGKTVITVTSQSNNKAVAKCNVTVSKPATIIVSFTAVSGTDVADNNIIFQETEKMYGIKLQMIRFAAENFAEKLGLLIASNKTPDVIGEGVDWRLVAKQDAIGELPDSVLKKYLPKHIKSVEDIGEQVGVSPWDYFRYEDGKNYVIPKVWSAQLAPTYCRTIRMDILRKAGINKLPATIAEYDQAAAAVKKWNPNVYFFGGGGKDLYWQCFTDVYGAYGYIPNTFIFDKKTGKITNSNIMPEMKQALAKLAEWQRNGYIDPEWLTDGEEADWSKHINGKHVSLTWAWIGYSIPNAKKLMNYDNFWEKMKALDPDADVVSAPYVIGPSGKSGWPGGIPFVNSLAFSKAMVANTEKLTRFLQMYESLLYDNPEAYFSFLYGRKGVEWNYDKNGIARVKEGILGNKNEENRIGINGGQGRMMTKDPILGEYEKYFPRGVAEEFVQTWRDKYPKSQLYSPASILSAPAELGFEGRLGLLQREYFDGIILGTKSIDKFDEFVTRWLKEGGQQQLDWQNANNLKFWKK